MDSTKDREIDAIRDQSCSAFFEWLLTADTTSSLHSSVGGCLFLNLPLNQQELAGLVQQNWQVSDVGKSVNFAA